MARDAPTGLPMAGQPPTERADATRNRMKILRAAAAMIAERGAAELSLDEVAKAAEVGVATVYRKYRDRSQLIFALLDEQEREFQQAFINGPPPLGPGAPPGDRIHAFLHALVDRMETQVDLLLLAENTSSGRFRSVPYAVHHTHLSILLAQLIPEADSAYLADALLAPLSATLVSYQLKERGLSIDEVRAGLDDLLRLMGCPLSH
ncbi:TetR/AcrR family transcriptional regulator [Actinomadura syzygii]|nr:TetR/AcrR family transcriptional regulator [Actinomadura syzygii]